jgi:AcrR family transcriptional regulator
VKSGTRPNARGGRSNTVRAADTRERILAVSAKMFRERGFEATTTRDLADAVGIRGPSLYHHFETKDDLLFGVCQESLRRLAEASRPIETQAEPRARLIALIDAHVNAIVRDRDLHAAMLIEMRALSGERQRTVIWGRDDHEALVLRTIEYAQTHGVLRKDHSARELSFVLLNLLNWTVTWFDPRGQMTAAQFAQLIASVFLDGAATSGGDPPHAPEAAGTTDLTSA